MNTVTQALDRFAHGDSHAADELLTLVYDELRKLAQTKMRTQPAAQTLQPTALVHEAWLRITAAKTQQWESRKHFYAAAAQSMRHILLERARRKQRLRHGGELDRVDLDDIEIAAPLEDTNLLRINDALEELSRFAPEKAEVVNLRFFVGLEEGEIAELLGISPRTVERYWAYAKAWLYDHISESA